MSIKKLPQLELNKLLTLIELKLALKEDNLRRVEIYTRDGYKTDYYSCWLPYVILDFNGVLGFKKKIQAKSRYAWDRADDYLYRLVPFKTRFKKCPHCYENLVETPSDGYYGQCLKCDKDFYSFEL